MLPPVDSVYSRAPIQAPTYDPAPVTPGTRDYYQQRVDDFLQRNPGMAPPDYYLGYGDKYMERFESLDATDLSPDGLQWRDNTTLALQQAIEEYRIRDPEGFAELERDPQAFREFAFGTHPDAYADSGLYGLPVQDLMVIAATPDIGDVLSQEGIDQSLITLGKLEPGDLPEIALDTGEQYLRDTGPFAFTPFGPALGATRQGERLLDRLSEQSWFPDLPDLPDLPDVSLPDLPDIDLPDIDVPGIPGI